MTLALKIDVDTYRGTRQGIPCLLRLLDRHRLRATFLFSLGPDHTGRAVRRVLRPGFFSKVTRTSVLEHYGLKTLLYGTLLPGPDIGRRCRAELHAVRDAGHEIGIHCYDHVRWQDHIAKASPRWTERELRRAVERFTDVFAIAPRVHGAAGWQMNDTAFELTETLGFRYASDTRGSGPFLPRIGVRTLQCPQLPTTLPTLDELIGLPDLVDDDPVTHLLAQTGMPHTGGHVFTLHAELEGQKLVLAFEKLLAGWRGQGWRLGALQDSFDALQSTVFPVCRIARRALPGRSGLLSVQGEPVCQ